MARDKQQGQSSEAPELEEQTSVTLETNSDQFSVFPGEGLEWASLLPSQRLNSDAQEGKDSSQILFLCSAGLLACHSTSLRQHV